ncbi:hypothetical protein OS493_024021 [Desmophyllum pertusum]|uniref:Uncharacterized protein n=1 Tax=Desmophyllum pertusum TaxID=174260 RepID=A0A9W9ZQ83_9CNID|nr:hypothetical protein OS493_024021 [Desmophyllum pertusum]
MAITDHLYALVAAKMGITCTILGFIRLSLEAMRRLELNDKVNLVIKLCQGFAVDRPDKSGSLMMPLGQMPFGLLQYCIEFFTCTNVMQATASSNMLMLNFELVALQKLTVSQQDVDESQIALSIEIPYYLLKEWHRKVDKSDPEATTPNYISLVNETHSWSLCPNKPSVKSNVSVAKESLKNHIRELLENDPSYDITEPVKVKISDDGAKMSQLYDSFSLLQTGEKVMSSRGNRTIAIVNGPEKYDTLKHSFSSAINGINTVLKLALLRLMGKK